MSLGLIICGDCDFLSSCQLDGLTVFQKSCTDFRALQKNATSYSPYIDLQLLQPVSCAMAAFIALQPPWGVGMRLSRAVAYA